jgi:hypothetical protein
MDILFYHDLCLTGQSQGLGVWPDWRVGTWDVGSTMRLYERDIIHSSIHQKWIRFVETSILVGRKSSTSTKKMTESLLHSCRHKMAFGGKGKDPMASGRGVLNFK